MDGWASGSHGPGLGIQWTTILNGRRVAVGADKCGNEFRFMAIRFVLCECACEIKTGGGRLWVES